MQLVSKLEFLQERRGGEAERGEKDIPQGSGLGDCWGPRTGLEWAAGTGCTLPSLRKLARNGESS